MTTAPIIPVELIAPMFNPQTFASPKRVDEIMSVIRRDYPLAVAEVPGYDRHWIVSKWSDLREISRQDEIFRSNENSKTLVTHAGQEMIRDFTGGKPNFLQTLVQMDPPEHPAYRAVTAPLFTPQAVAQREGFVRELAKKYVDKFLASGPTLDFAKNIAFEYPLEVILTVAGVPREDHAHILQLAQWFFNYVDPDLRRPDSNPEDPEQVVKTWRMVLKFYEEYAEKITSERRSCPRDDVATILANAKIDGCPMSNGALASYFLILGTAGHDTTAATTAMSMWVLAERPELLARLKSNPDDLPKFIEEAIRWTCPVKHFIRTAARDYELRGQTIKKGDRLYLSYISANRDEEIFENPFTFDIDRQNNRQQVGFGYGGHTCLGQHFARLEMRKFWEELLPRLRSVTLAGVPTVGMSELVAGPKYVPVTFEAE